MLYMDSWRTTLPVLAAGIAGIFLVMGVLVLAVLLLNRCTGKTRDEGPDAPDGPPHGT